MAETYFSKMRPVRYNGRLVTNIMERAAILDKVMANPYVFYPYDVTEGERPDQFAQRYYGDAYMSWLVYMANDIIDPYYGWVMSDQEFREYIVRKYGSIEDSIRLITGMRNAWHVDRTETTVQRYSAFDISEKKYWEPVITPQGTVRAYVRRKADWRVNTNRIVQYDVYTDTLDEGESFNDGEKIRIQINDAFPTDTGNAIIAHVSHEVVTLEDMSTVYRVRAHHTEGQVLASNTVPFGGGPVDYARISGPNVANAIIASATLVVENIPAVEEHYWEQVRAYDEEVERNQNNRSIRVLDKAYSAQVAYELRKLLGGSNGKFSGQDTPTVTAALVQLGNFGFGGG